MTARIVNESDEYVIIERNNGFDVGKYIKINNTCVEQYVICTCIDYDRAEMVMNALIQSDM